ncbi:hypothetical protein BST61_g7594 [Cercospora zeina]
MASFSPTGKFDWAEDVEEALLSGSLGPPEMKKTNCSSERRVADSSKSTQGLELPRMELIGMGSMRGNQRHENERASGSAMNGGSELPEIDSMEPATRIGNRSEPTAELASLADHEEEEFPKASSLPEIHRSATKETDDSEPSPSLEPEHQTEEQPEGSSLTNDQTSSANSDADTPDSAASGSQSDEELSKTSSRTESSLSANEQTEDPYPASLDSSSDETELLAPSALAQICRGAWGSDIESPDLPVHWSLDDENIVDDAGESGSALTRRLRCAAAREGDGEGNVSAEEQSEAEAGGRRLPGSETRLRANGGRRAESIGRVRGTENNLQIRYVVWANILALVACFLCLCVQLRLLRHCDLRIGEV